MIFKLIYSKADALNYLTQLQNELKGKQLFSLQYKERRQNRRIIFSYYSKRHTRNVVFQCFRSSCWAFIILLFITNYNVITLRELRALGNEYENSRPPTIWCCPSGHTHTTAAGR